MEYVVILANIFNLLDLLTTHIALNKPNCIELNLLVHINPIAFYILKPLLILVLTLILYRLTRNDVKLISKTSKVLLWFVMVLNLLAVINNTIILTMNR